MNLQTMNGIDLLRALRGGCVNLEKHREQVDKLNVFPVPDGDTGTNMFLTISSAYKEAEKNVQPFLGKVMKPTSMGSLMGARGNSGVILSQIFRGMAKELGGMETVGAKDMARALKLGADTAYKAVMKPVEGTILTVIREVARASEEAATESDDILWVLRSGVRAGNEILLKTPQMLPILKEAGVVDSGGQGLLFFLQGFVAGLADETEDEETLEEEKLMEEATKALTFPYCVEMLVGGAVSELEMLRSKLNPMGEELILEVCEEGIKVHIHTAHPGEVLEYGLQSGKICKVQVLNLEDEAHEAHIQFAKVKEEPLKKIGLVAVAAGEGLEKILKGLNVDEIVHGGQTMNPSTEDILKACNQVKAESIIVLPNNSNIIMAANQVKAICEKKVVVLPTKNVTQAISALVEFDADADIEVVESSMMEKISQVVYGELTSAVRDVQIDGVDVKNGDYIGLVEGHIKADGTNREQVLFDMVRQMVQDDNEIMMLLYGAEVNPEEAKQMQQKLEKEFDWCEVELHYGGQAHYDYLISVE